jgi:hypothetical protein
MARDRDAFNAAWRRWYRKNAQRKIAWQKRRRAEMRAWWAALKAGKACERCGEAAPECLQFHHVDARLKRFEIGAAVHDGLSKQRIVLCANCHLIHHWNRRQQN